MRRRSAQSSQHAASFRVETARNFAELGVPRALTGPAVRDDWPTISRHIAALTEESPDAVALYRELTRQMLAFAGKRMAALVARD